jgi:hypothetical protein
MRLRRSAVPFVLLLALAACADRPTGTTDAGIEHATASTDLLVRVAFEGGFVPVEWTYTGLPPFSLFGDGTVVLPGAQIEIYPGPALPAISSRHVNEAGIQAILAAALDATRDLPDDLGDMGTIGIADAPDTVITVSAGGVDRTIRVYALSELTERPPGMPEDVYRARQRLAELVTKLGSLDPWLPEGSLGPDGTFEGSAARLLVRDYRPAEDLPQHPVAWPLGINLASFGAPTAPDHDLRCGTVDGDGWAAVREAAGQANELTPWTDGAAQRFSILFRPLLPDETGCEPIPPAA